jgi:molybdopterin molybdotransferase
MVPALIDELGGEVTDLRHVADHPAGQLGAVVESVAPSVSVIVVTGSTSVGATDRLRPFIERIGARWVVDTVACRPGHPQLLADLGRGRWLVGLPGNPFAALVAAHTLLAPLLAGLTGRPQSPLLLTPINGAVPPGKPGQTRLLPVVWDGNGVQVMAGHQPAFLRGAALADAIAVIPPEWTRGQPVGLLLSQ